MSSEKLDAMIGTTSTSETSLLKRKRKTSLLENYLFRRVFTGKIDGRYEEIANIYYNLMSFNWDDERLGKYRNSMCKICLNL